MAEGGGGATGRRVALAALLLSASVALSRVVGFVREAVLAYQVGVAGDTDAYQAAFQIPDLLNYFLAGGALSIAFIPLYASARETRGEAAAQRFFATVFGTMGCAAALAAAALWIWAPQLVALQFPGFDTDQQELTVRLTRIVLPAQIFFVTGGIVRGALMARGRFAAQAASPVLYNLAIIAGGLLLGPRLGVEGFAWGALAGAVLGPFGAGLWEARGRLRLGARVAPTDRDFLQYLVRAAPLFLGISLLTVDEWYDRWFGSVLAMGTIATLVFARRLMHVPVALVGQAVATAALPTFTRLHAQGERETLDRVALRTLQAALGLGVIGATAMFVLAEPLVRAVYVRGAFSQEDAAGVVAALQVFTLGIPAWIVSQIATRVFYARGDTWRPMLLATVVALSAVPLYLELGPRYGAPGLAGAGALAMTGNALAVLLLSRIRHGGPALGPLALSGLRAAAAAALGAALVLILRPVLGLDWPGFLGALGELTVGAALFAVASAPAVLWLGDAALREAAGRLLSARAGEGDIVSAMKIHGPERPGGQGLDPQQEESGNRAILALLKDPKVADQTDLVVTWRAGEGGEPGAYEVWSGRGMVRFQRVIDGNGALAYEVLEVVGENPIGEQDPHALRNVDEERAAARASGFEDEDPARRFIAPEHQSYPFGYERVAQLFDSPHAPDLVISPRDWCQGVQAGTHGALHVRQARAPLWLSGPGIQPGPYDLVARAVDVAPTCLAALGFPLVGGADATGRGASERGAEPDVYLARQDGRALTEILVSGGNPPKRLYIFLLDGIHHTELEDRLAGDPEALPNLRRLRDHAAVLQSGSIVNFPSITWPSHTTIGTGTWCGHHDVVNPTYYLRDKRETVSPQGQQVRTEHFSSRTVESLHEAFHRVRGADCLTAAIYAPFGRGADHAVLEGRNLGDRSRLKALTLELAVDCNRRWAADDMDAVERESVLDTRGVAQVVELFTCEDRPAPHFVFHEMALTDGAGHDYGPHSEGLRDALDESDRRVGRVLDLLSDVGLLDETLFVLTADHGMAPQDVTLRANPARHVEKAGLVGVVAEPMIWLHDLSVEVERAADGRTARVLVCENDALPSGERPAVEGAEVVVEIHEGEAERARSLAHGSTGPGGVFGFATPSEVSSERIAVSVHREGFNARRVRLDGLRLAVDLRRALYGT